MSDNSTYVRDMLDASFVLIESHKTVAEASQKLSQAGRTYAVVISPREVPVGLVTAGALSSAPDASLKLGDFLSLPTIIVDADVLLDQAVSFSAQTLVETPDISGLVIEEKRKVIGILTRQTILKYAERDDNRSLRGAITEMAGDPLSRAKYFVCPKKNFMELVIQYDPDNPPTCPIDNLVLVKQP